MLQTDRRRSAHSPARRLYHADEIIDIFVLVRLCGCGVVKNSVATFLPQYGSSGAALYGRRVGRLTCYRLSLFFDFGGELVSSSLVLLKQACFPPCHRLSEWDDAQYLVRYRTGSTDCFILPKAGSKKARYRCIPADIESLHGTLSTMPDRLHNVTITFGSGSFRALDNDEQEDTTHLGARCQYLGCWPTFFELRTVIGPG